MTAPAIFVTGTDTEVGKTWVASALVGAMRARGIDAVGMKPIECGGRDDGERLLAAGERSDLTIDEVNPLSLSEPLAPAAIESADAVDFAVLSSAVAGLREKSEFVVVEGAGGWLVPLDAHRTLADFAGQLGLPVLLVAANRLGALNHTLLTTRAIADAGLPCAGVYLNTLGDANDPAARSNRAVLERVLPDEVPVFVDDLDGLAESLLDF